MVTMAWTLLVIAGLLEIVWATALKQSDGFTRFWPSVVGITFALASFLLLARALRHLPIGTAYAVWVGIGTMGVAFAGIVIYGEPATTLRLLCIAVILIGIIGLRAIEG